ncbi:EamA family transporter [Paraburkholderia sp. BR10954]|uniref:EamA family transporter n=1 Tax=Paraburkholderia sp. BR10954 TaxID=3236995 RepID=UPI0034D244EA
MEAIHIAAALLVPLLWGFQYVVVKAGLTVLPPLFFAGLRFAVIAAILIPFVARIRGPEIWPILLIFYTTPDQYTHATGFLRRG